MIVLTTDKWGYHDLYLIILLSNKIVEYMHYAFVGSWSVMPSRLSMV
jgi:hypothetical protein